MTITGIKIAIEILLEIEHDYGIRWTLEAETGAVENIIEGILIRKQDELGEAISIDDGEGHLIEGPKEMARWLWQKIKEIWKELVG